MSNTAMPPLDLERAEEIARQLAAAVSARRIYAPDHTRVTVALRKFLQPLHAAFEGEGPDRLRLTVTGGILTHEGVPLGTKGLTANLAQLFAERDCGGVLLLRGLTDATASWLVDWLSGRRPAIHKPRGDGIELLAPGAGEELQDEQQRGRLLERLPEFKIPKEVLESSLEVFGHVLQDARDGRALDIKEITDLARFACEVARSEGANLFAATQLPREHPAACDHAVNVFLIATSLLQPFARDAKELQVFSQAAMLHDIGTSWVPEDILLKPGALTPEEESYVRRHPEYGARILASLPHIDPLAVEVAYCHHMRDDGEGFPVPIMPIKAGPVTNLVQVGDMFEAVAETRPRGVGLGVEQAANAVLTSPGMGSKEPALAHLVRRLTDAPPGAEVRLENGQRAIVVHVYPDTPHHPRVRVVRESDGRAVKDPYVVELKDAGPDARPIAEVYLKPA